jgi:hypothetical protein
LLSLLFDKPETKNKFSYRNLKIDYFTISSVLYCFKNLTI